MSIVIALSVPDAITSGVAYFKTYGSRGLTAVLVDGSQRSSNVPADLVRRIRAYHRYQTKDNAPKADCPNWTEMLSEIETAISGLNTRWHAVLQEAQNGN